MEASQPAYRAGAGALSRDLTSSLIPIQNLACLYEAGWPVRELAHLQVRSCLPGHNFVNISLRLYALPRSRLARLAGLARLADISVIEYRDPASSQLTFLI